MDKLTSILHNSEVCRFLRGEDLYKLFCTCRTVQDFVQLPVIINIIKETFFSRHKKLDNHKFDQILYVLKEFVERRAKSSGEYVIYCKTVNYSHVLMRLLLLGSKSCFYCKATCNSFNETIFFPCKWAKLIITIPISFVYGNIGTRMVRNNVVSYDIFTYMLEDNEYEISWSPCFDVCFECKHKYKFCSVNSFCNKYGIKKCRMIDMIDRDTADISILKNSAYFAPLKYLETKWSEMGVEDSVKLKFL